MAYKAAIARPTDSHWISWGRPRKSRKTALARLAMLPTYAETLQIGKVPACAQFLFVPACACRCPPPRVGDICRRMGRPHAGDVA